MLLAACVDAGLRPADFGGRLRHSLHLPFRWRLAFRRVQRAGWPALALRVEGDRPISGPQAMKALVRQSRLPARVRAGTLEVLDRLTWAERRAHRSSRTHWHELASLDTLVDVAGSLLALDSLGVERVYCSSVLAGRLSPATAALLRDAPVIQREIRADFETTTPTGAALLRQIAYAFGPMPPMLLKATGFGAGAQETPWPNVLSVAVGVEVPEPPRGLGPPPKPQWLGEQALLLETNIDDLDPRILPYVVEKLIKSGCMDAWVTPVVMKKGRPAFLLSVLAPPRLACLAAETLFSETTTLGIRVRPVDRWLLARRSRGKWKEAALGGGRVKRSVEFEEALKQARRTGRPLREMLLPWREHER